MSSEILGDWEGSCRKCWKTRNLGPGYRPNDKDVACFQTNPDGTQCHGKLLIGLTKDAEKRVKAGRRLKKASEYKR